MKKLKIKVIPMLCMILSTVAVLSMTELTAQAQMVSGIYYVTVSGAGERDGSSWANAMSDLQEAIEAAAEYANTQGEGATGEVRIAEGVYYPTGYPNKQADVIGEREKHFSLRNKVSVIGGFAGYEETVVSAGSERDILVPTGNDTILSGDLGIQGDVKDNAYHVFFHPKGTNLDETAVLMNVIVKDGNAEFHQKYCRCGCSCGGGMYNSYSSPTITDCTFMDNSAAADGGAVENRASRPVLTSCTFTRNHAANYGGAVCYGGVMDNHGVVDYNGAMLEGQSSPLVIGCVFTNNSVDYYGGGIYSVDGNLTVASSRFEDNRAGSWGGGMCIRFAKSPRLIECKFLNNKSEFGGAMYASTCGLTMTDCTFTGNAAAMYGGGILLNLEGSLKLDDCDFTENEAEDLGGGIFNRAWVIKAERCAFNGNMADDGGGIYNEKGSLNINDCTFVDNVAYWQTESGDVGGSNYSNSGYFEKKESLDLPKTGDRGRAGWPEMIALSVTVILFMAGRWFTVRSHGRIEI